MKLFKYTFIAALALSGALCACSDDNDYAPGSAVTGDEVYFSLDEASAVSLEENATSFELNVNRLNTDDAITVPVSALVTDEDGVPVTDVFSFPASVSFAKGEDVAPFTVDVDFSKVVADAVYNITLTLSGDNTTPYGASSRTFAVSYAPWTDWGIVPGEWGVYTAKNALWSGDDEVPVLFRQSLTNPDNVQYAVCNIWFYDNDNPYLVNYIYNINLKNTIEVDGVECPLVSMVPFDTEYENGDAGILMFYDIRTWLLYGGVSEDEVDAVMQLNGWGPSYYNPQTGTFCMDIVLTATEIAAAGRYYSAAYEYLQLPGFKSYELSFEYVGNFVDAYKDEVAIVEAYKSDDVNNFICDIYAGELDEAGIAAAIEELKANEDIEAYTSSTKLTYALPEAGKYTIVGVGRDAEGEQVCKAAYTFNYKSVQGAAEEEPWHTYGICWYRDTFVSQWYPAVNYPEWQVEVQESDETPGFLRLVNPYEVFCNHFQLEYPREDKFIYVHAEKNDEIWLEPSLIGVTVDSSDGEYGVFSLAGNDMLSGETTSDYFGTFENNMITFPAGTLLFCCVDYKDGAWFYSNIDPDNKTKDPFNPFWGEGMFRIDFNDDAATAAKVKHHSIKNSPFVTFSNAMKAGKEANKGHFNGIVKKNFNNDDIKSYRLSNQRQVIR